MSQELLTWSELRALPVGTLLVFPEPGHDIYPYCTVQPGTLAIVFRATDDGIIDLLPADPEVCAALNEWDGCIQFNPRNDGYDWGDESPVAIWREKVLVHV